MKRRHGERTRRREIPSLQAERSVRPEIEIHLGRGNRQDEHTLVANDATHAMVEDHGSKHVRLAGELPRTRRLRRLASHPLVVNGGTTRRRRASRTLLSKGSRCHCRPHCSLASHIGGVLVRGAVARLALEADWENRIGAGDLLGQSG